jgi:GDPmannose 4,6-dehydratase
LELGYKVVCVNRRSSSANSDWRIKHLFSNPNFIVENGDVTDSGSINRIVRTHMPTEFYNLAAQSHVKVSWDEPQHTLRVNAGGVVNCLEALRNLNPLCRFYQASTSELFGKVQEIPQKETTPFYPRSPYGFSKLAGYWATVNYRESYGMFCCNGILFNHESERRGLEFVTRKITRRAAEIALGLESKLELGNINAQRDWGHAKDYMKAAWLMLQQDKPDDYVIATGKVHSIKQLLEVAFNAFRLDWKDYVEVNPSFIRPAEVELLLGDSTKAREVLNWKPEYTFEKLIKDMCAHDYMELKNG